MFKTWPTIFAWLISRVNSIPCQVSDITHFFMVLFILDKGFLFSVKFYLKKKKSALHLMINIHLLKLLHNIMLIYATFILNKLCYIISIYLRFHLVQFKSQVTENE